MPAARAPERWQPMPVVAAGVEYNAFSFDGHVHTNHSHDARHPPIEVLRRASMSGLDAVVITDHGTTAARNRVAGYDGRVLFISGEEIGGPYGHTVAWNFRARQKILVARNSISTLARAVHAEGGLLILAHPGWWIAGIARNPMNWISADALRRRGRSALLDAVELWNGTYFGPLRQLIDHWVGLLEQGVFVPIVSGSDFHRLESNPVANPRNVVLCATPSVTLDCILSAAREGRLYITNDPALSFVVNDALPGGVVSIAPGAPLHVTVAAQSQDGGRLDLYLGRTVVERLDLPPGETVRAEWTLAAPQADSFVRVEVVRHERLRHRPDLSLLSNPVRLDVPPARASWR